MTNQARQALLAGFKATTRECRFPGCQTLTLKDYCAKHRPLGEWAVSEAVRDELKEQERERDER